MFERFLDTFSLTSNFPKNTTGQFQIPRLLSKASGAVEFISNFEGSTFSNGLYRVHPIKEIQKWTRIVEKFFPHFKGRIVCFSYDWLGTQFALDSSLVLNGEPLIVMFDIGTGQVLKSQSSFHNFHNFEMVNYPNEALELDLFNQWKNLGNDELQLDQCIGYKVPLFLNGNHELSNLEVSSMDMEVYWELFGQILEQVRKLPPGTKISKIEIRE